MANIRKIEGKTGVSYKITVFSGRDIDNKQIRHYLTWTPEAGMTAKQAEKEVKRVAVEFERQCEQGYIADDKQTFAEYAAYVLNLKDRVNKRRTMELERDLLKRILPVIGHMKLRDIRPKHLNDLYTELCKEGARIGGHKALAKPGLKEVLKRDGTTLSAVAEKSGLGLRTISCMCNEQRVTLNSAQKLSVTLGRKLEDLFTVEKNTKPLNSKTVLQYHHLISTILAQAEKEMIIPYNPASKATPPKIEKKEVNYFQVEEVLAIRDALEKAPIKWRTFTHLLLITGARRGEIAGLKWDKVDLENKTILIDRALLYSKDRGVYEDTPKTASSRRIVSLPPETVALLKEYRKHQLELRMKMGVIWTETGYLFTQENGQPMFPDSITNWLNRFSKLNGLPHINPHAFRHTMASLLYFKGMDAVTISKRLGHGQVSTTANIYAHIMQEADSKAAETIADAVLRKQ